MIIKLINFFIILVHKSIYFYKKMYEMQQYDEKRKLVTEQSKLL